MGIFRRVTGNSYLRGVSTLAGATLVAHILFILCSPLLTRLYTPEEFGLLALFLAMIASVSPAICGKYEVAIVLPYSERKAHHLFGIAVIISTALSLLLLLVLMAGGAGLLGIIGAESLADYIILVPAGLFLSGLIQAGSFFANREKRYPLMARSQLIHTVFIILVSIALGLGGGGAIVLILAYIAGYAVRAFLLTRKVMPGLLRDIKNNWTVKKMLARHFIDYPLFNASSGLLNGITLALPVFFLNSFVSEAFVGLYMISQRIISQPLMAIATAISPVNMRHVVDEIQAGNALFPYLARLFLVLCLFAAVPVVIILTFAGQLIPFLFGQQWEGAVIIAQVMCIPFAFRFVVTSMSSTYGATNNSRIAFIRRVLSFLILITVFVIVGSDRDEIAVIYLLAYAFVIDDLISLGLIFFSGARPGYR